MKFILILSALFVISEARIRTSNITEGSIIQGAKAKGVTIKTKGEKIEVSWQEEFNYKNSLKVYFDYFFEETGLRDIIKIDNLCQKYEKGSPEHSVQHYVIEKLGNTKHCPIKKGTRFSMSLPVVHTYLVPQKDCGPIVVMLNIFRNNPKNPKVTPLLISGMLRGTVTGSDC